MNTIKKIEMYARGIQDSGPTKILIEENIIVNPKNTEIKPSVAFIRNDGWSLGVPEFLIEKAEDLFDWVAILTIQSNKVKLLKEHKIK